MLLGCGAVAWFFAVAFFGWGGFEIGVGRTNFKIGLGVGSGIEGADGANFEIGTPDPRLLFGWLAKSSNLDGLADQSKCLQNRGLVIGWPGLPVGAQRAFRFSSLLAWDRNMRSVFNSFPSSGLGTQVFEAPLRRLARRQPIPQAIRETSNYESGNRLNHSRRSNSNHWLPSFLGRSLMRFHRLRRSKEF